MDVPYLTLLVLHDTGVLPGLDIVYLQIFVVYEYVPDGLAKV